MEKKYLEIIPFNEVVVYPESLQDRINSCDLSRVDDQKDFGLFHTEITSAYKVLPKIIKIKKDEFFDGDELIRYMAKQEYRPANFYELLAFRRFNKDYPMRRKMHIISNAYRVSQAGYKAPTLYRTSPDDCELLVTYHSNSLQQGSKVLFVKIVF